MARRPSGRRRLWILRPAQPLLPARRRRRVLPRRGRPAPCGLAPDLCRGAGGHAGLCRARSARRLRGAPARAAGQHLRCARGRHDVRLRHDSGPRLCQPAARALGQWQSQGAAVGPGVCGDGAGFLSRPAVACARVGEQSVACRRRAVARHHGGVRRRYAREARFRWTMADRGAHLRLSQPFAAPAGSSPTSCRRPPSHR